MKRNKFFTCLHAGANLRGPSKCAGFIRLEEAQLEYESKYKNKIFYQVKN